MAYQPVETKVLHGLEALRANPRLYFRQGKPTGLELLEWAISDLAHHQAFDIRLARQGPYFAVSATTDWMRSPHATFDRLFEGIVPIGPSSPNDMRAEVIFAAFADGTFTIGPHGTFQDRLSLRDLPTALHLPTGPQGRLLAWCFNGEVD